MNRSNVLAFALQTALKRAHPSALASNQVLNQFGAPYDTLNVVDDVQAIVTPVGYPYGYGERVSASAGTQMNIVAIGGDSVAMLAYAPTLTIMGMLLAPQ